MRKLHPIGSHEVLVRGSRYARPDRSVEEGTVHALGGGRHAVRVTVEGARRNSLWHLILDENGAPERLQARFQEDGPVVDVTLTFFEDEVLVWRRGAGIASEAIALPPGYRLLWPPFTGRGLALKGLPAANGPDARIFALIRLRPLAEGAIEVRPVKFAIQPAPGGLTLGTPGLPDARAEIGPDGELIRWHSEGNVVERVPLSAGVSPVGAVSGMMMPATLVNDVEVGGTRADDSSDGDQPANDNPVGDYREGEQPSSGSRAGDHPERDQSGEEMGGSS